MENPPADPVVENEASLELPSSDVTVKNEVMVTEHHSDDNYNHFLPQSGQNSETTSSPEESPIFVGEVSNAPNDEAQRQDGHGLTRYIGPNRAYHFDIPPKWKFYGDETKYLLVHEPNNKYRMYKDRNRATNNRIYYDCVYCTKFRKCAFIHLDKVDGQLVMDCCPADDFHVDGCNTMTFEEVENYIINNPSRRPRKKGGRASFSRSASVCRSLREGSEDNDTEYRRPLRSMSVSPERRPSSRRTSKTDMLAAISAVLPPKTLKTPEVPAVGQRVSMIYVPDNNHTNLVRSYQWNGNKMVCSKCMKNGVEVALSFGNNGILFAPAVVQHVAGCLPYPPGVDTKTSNTAEDYEINDNTLVAGGREYYCPGAKKEIFCCKVCLEHDKITKATVKQVVMLPTDHCMECKNTNSHKIEEKMESEDEEEEHMNDVSEVNHSLPEKLLNLSARCASAHQMSEIDVQRPLSAIPKVVAPVYRRQRAMSVAPDGFAGGETVESDMWELVNNAGQGFNLLLRDKRNREYGWEFNANPRAVQNAVPYICRLCNITIGRVSKSGDQFILTSAHSCAPIPYVVLKNKYADMARGVFIRKKWWEEQERRYNFKRHSLDANHSETPSKYPRLSGAAR